MGFRHRGLRRLYEKDDPARVPAQDLSRIRLILAALDAAQSAKDVDIHTFHLHPLKGDLKGFWAITVRANWRIIFRSKEAAFARSISRTITERQERQTMPMKNPPHPGELIRENLKDLGLSVADAAAGLGVTRQQLYNLINGKSGITPEMALRLEKAFGGSADIWLRMQVNYDLARVRRRAAEITVQRLRPRPA